ncbi:hypothetical protein IW261DRAFT_1572589 [Armillaria novae-zelandiae]|uniref:Uncharacterized protein n=1 Tax=Armillaria novae-zelandiae TaxID=153914 RepID=A0AA39NS85_9AGAR|nr:hypothetical protein IW261DRAFT_1572589 [Armillaria novae-zelandiae]
MDGVCINSFSLGLAVTSTLAKTKQDLPPHHPITGKYTSKKEHEALLGAIHANVNLINASVLSLSLASFQIMSWPLSPVLMSTPSAEEFVQLAQQVADLTMLITRQAQAAATSLTSPIDMPARCLCM